MTTTERFARLELPGGIRWVRIDEGGAELFDGAPWSGGRATGERVAGVSSDGAGAGRRLAPVAPRKILCVGRNYRAHAKELGNEVPPEPMLFYKPPTALLDPGGTVELPPARISSRVEHEAELAVVVGERLRHATVDEAREAVFGVTAACDVTARDLQKKDGQWWRAKGMDGFCPVGPVVVTGVDPSTLGVRCYVNGDLRQDGHARDMIFSVPAVLAFVSETITLEPGDLVLTGTPEGVGPLRGGDRVAVEVDAVGALEFGVAGG